VPPVIRRWAFFERSLVPLGLLRRRRNIHRFHYWTDSRKSRFEKICNQNHEGDEAVDRKNGIQYEMVGEQPQTREAQAYSNDAVHATYIMFY